MVGAPDLNVLAAAIAWDTTKEDCSEDSNLLGQSKSASRRTSEWHTDVSTWSGGQPWRLSPFHRRKHCWCAHTSLPANFQCSHHIVFVPFCMICSLHLIAVWFWQAIWQPEWSLQLPSFLAFYVSTGRTGRSNTFLRKPCFKFHFAATWSPNLPSHAMYRVIDIALLCPSSHTWFQDFFVMNPSALLQDLYHALRYCLTSLLLCAVLYVITFASSFISSPECAHLSPSTCQSPFMFFAPHSLLPLFELHLSRHY